MLIDTKTGIRAPLDAQYDIKELASKFAELSTSTSDYVLFRFANGQVISLPPIWKVLALGSNRQLAYITITNGQATQKLSVDANHSWLVVSSDSGSTLKVSTIAVSSISSTSDSPVTITGARLRQLLAANATAYIKQSSIHTLTTATASIANCIIKQLSCSTSTALNISSLTTNSLTTATFTAKSEQRVFYNVQDTKAVLTWPDFSTKSMASAYLQGSYRPDRIDITEAPTFKSGSAYALQMPVCHSEGEDTLFLTDTTSTSKQPWGYVPSEVLVSGKSIQPIVAQTVFWPEIALYPYKACNNTYASASGVDLSMVMLPPLAACNNAVICVHTGSKELKVQNAWQFDSVSTAISPNFYNYVTLPRQSCIAFLFTFTVNAAAGIANAYMMPMRSL